MAGWPVDIPGVGGLPEMVAGLHVKVDVDNPERERWLVEKALGVGVELNALSDYWWPETSPAVDKKAGLVLGFAAVGELGIAEALEKLKKAWKG